MGRIVGACYSLRERDAMTDNLLPDERQLADAEAKMSKAPWLLPLGHAFAEYDGKPLSADRNDAGSLGIIVRDEDADGIVLLRNGIRPLLERVARMRKGLEQILHGENNKWAREIAREALEEKP